MAQEDEPPLLSDNIFVSRLRTLGHRSSFPIGPPLRRGNSATTHVYYPPAKQLPPPTEEQAQSDHATTSAKSLKLSDSDEAASKILNQMVVDFTASWCGPCRVIAPFLSDLAKKLPNVIFAKIDVDELKTVAQDWAIESMPTFMFLKEGNILDKVVGAQKEALAHTVAWHLTTAFA